MKESVGPGGRLRPAIKFRVRLSDLECGPAEQACACDLRLPENCDGQVYPPVKLSIARTAKLMRAALYKDVRLRAHSARENGSGLLFRRVVRLSQCVTQPVSGILESVQQNVVGQSSVK